MRLELHVDGPEDGEPQSPIPLSAWEAFGRVLEVELSSLYPEIVRYGTVELSVTLLGPDEMRSVNREYRERDEATDVLSFPLWEADGRFLPDGTLTELLPLGDILICPEEVARLHEGLPPVHYLIGFAGCDVRCTEYAPFGSPELARLAFEGMRDRYAVLLGNHGLLAAGPDVRYAFNAAEEIEFVCELYCRARSMGKPVLLSEADMEVVLEKFKSYGQRD